MTLYRPSCALVLASLALLLAPSLARADLESYVKASDAAFAFKVVETRDLPGIGKAAIVRLVSQKWQGIEWQHWLTVIRPEKVTRPEHALLVVSGGSIKKDPPQSLSGEALLLAQVAGRTGSIVAVLGQVPNQPLFANLKEDALIAYTFQKFVETGDDTWPCLLPMTKSAVRAMDVVQAIARESGQEVKRFVVTGASKRGWTTWLTGAVDPRVEAIAPMVIDTLNMAKQMPHQLLSFGTYSEQIEDYTRLNLPGRVGEPASNRLLAMVDPYSYLKKLTMPKLIMLGTNDRYWPVDAVKLYFPDLPGEKYIHYVPNAGHGLRPEAAQVVLAFYETVLAGEKRPRFDWKLRNEGPRAALTVTPEDPPEKAELWTASAPTRDFREAKWSSKPLEKGAGGRYEAQVDAPAEGFEAFFVSLTYKSSLGHSYTLETNVEVLGTKPLAKK